MNESPREQSPFPPLGIAIGLAALVGLLFGRGISGYFLADDYANVAFGASVPLARWPRLFLHDLPNEIWGYPLGQLRPLAGLLLIIEGRLFGPTPWGYHVTSLALHTLNAGLVFAIARRLIGGAQWRALAAALLFAVHPVHAEAVMWISGQTDLLPTAAALGSMLAFLRFRSGGSNSDAAGCVALAFVGVFSKENCVVLPAIFAAYEFLCGRAAPEPALATVSRRRSVLLTAGVALVVLIYLVCRRIAYGGGSGVPAFTTAVATIFRQLPSRYCEYTLHLLSPLDSPSFARLGAVMIAASLLIGLSLLAWRRQRRTETAGMLLFTGPIWFCLTTAPFLFSYSSTRHLYFTSAGFCIFATAAIAHVGKSRTPQLILMAIALTWIPISCHEVSAWRRAGSITRDVHRQIVELAATPRGTALVIDLPFCNEDAYTLAWSSPYLFGAPFCSPSLRGHFIAAVDPNCFYAPDRWWTEFDTARLATLTPLDQAYLIAIGPITRRVRKRRLDPSKIVAATRELTAGAAQTPAAPYDSAWRVFADAVR